MMIQSPFRDYYDYVGDGTHTFPTYERRRVVDVSHLGIINTMHSVLPSSTNLSSGYQQGISRKLSKSTPRLHVSYTHKNTKYRFREVSVLGDIVVYMEVLYPDREESFFTIPTIKHFKNYLYFNNSYPEFESAGMKQHVSTRSIFQLWASGQTRTSNLLFVRVPEVGKCPGVCSLYKDFNYQLHKRLGIPVISELEADKKTNIIQKVYTYELYRIEGIQSVFPPVQLYGALESFLNHLT